MASATNAASSGGMRNERLRAVVQFAETALEKGRDRYGKEPTPLLVDGIRVDTLEPVRWAYRGEKYGPGERRPVIHNLALQQNFFRTLVGLSNLTGDPRYRRVAEDSFNFHFQHLASPCGLLRWGGHQIIDLSTGKPLGDFIGACHEFKTTYPYYQLMWEVDPKATERFIKALWNAHVIDWSTLTFNRHGGYGKSPGPLWDQPFADREPHVLAPGLTFINCGSDLIFAASYLYHLAGDKGALTWAKRLARMYVKARHPKTGLGSYQYTLRAEWRPGGLVTPMREDDMARKQFGPEYGDSALEAYYLSIGRAQVIYGLATIVQMQVAELLGEEGSEFVEWARDGLLAYARHAYDPDANELRPLFADGTDLTGYVFPRGGYFGREGTVLRRQKPSGVLFWSYALAHRLTGDPMLWETVRQMARGFGMGEIGRTPGGKADPGVIANVPDPEVLFGLLEVYRATGNPAHLDLARQAGDALLRGTFHGGYFLPSSRHVHVKWDNTVPLALLALEACERGEPGLVPTYNAGHGYIHAFIDDTTRTTDRELIYSQTR